ncbi:MAG TPA: hypothetical protein VL051_07805 [Burkholderiaceae bacterium]|nr:hypothetical protein [Burkholderiaceae bacterium]
MLQQLRLNLSMVFGSALLFLLSFGLNEWLFANSEFVRGINWIYLPAGMRLLCTLLFGGAGALGVLLASCLTSLLYYFPGDLERALLGAAISAAAPYLVYLLAQKIFGLQASLANLTARRLLWLVVLYALASPLLLHVGFWLHGGMHGTLNGFLVMFGGDLLGSLVVVYIMKSLLWLLPRKKLGAAPLPPLG